MAADRSRMKATVSAPADHDGAGRVLGGAVRRDALALEELHLEVEDAAHVVGRERGGNVVGEVREHPLVGILEVEERRRRVPRDAARLASHDEGGDRDDEAHDDETGDHLHLGRR